MASTQPQPDRCSASSDCEPDQSSSASRGSAPDLSLIEEVQIVDSPCNATLPVSGLEHNMVVRNDHHEPEYWPTDPSTTHTPSFGLQGSNFFMDNALPIIIENNDIGVTISQPSPLASQPPPPVYSSLSAQDALGTMVDIWPPYISEVSLIPWIDVYFDRLHPTLPILNRASLFTRFFLREHHHNPVFGSMLLALCAFAIAQPIFVNERSTSSMRARQAKSLIDEATKMRSSAEFGENPDLEAVLTSFFLFGCLFSSNQHNAAWLRLREAIDLAVTMGLNNPDSYRHLADEVRGQYMRARLILSITERSALNQLMSFPLGIELILIGHMPSNAGIP